jgi:putative ABC transport system permease protein
MLRLAYHNLFQNRLRLVMSVGGVSLALLLILALDAIMVGIEGRITAYIDHSGADVFVSQAGVRNMHMASSSLPTTVVGNVRDVPGVLSATPILYLSNVVVMGEERTLAYVIGLPSGAEVGKPWQVAEGKAAPAVGEALVDRGVAAKSEKGVGDTVQIVGRDFRVAGLTEGTATLVNYIAFVAMDDLAATRGAAQTVSFVLVQVEPDVTPETVAARIEQEIEGVTAQTRADFAAQERKVVKDMSTDIITIMNLAGFLIGLAVMALTVYTATLARRAEYGVLKALGARNSDLYQAVLAQAMISVALGFAVGLALTLLLARVVPALVPNQTLQVSIGSLLKVGSVSLLIAGFSALLPIRQIASLDPAVVFRRR